MGTESLKALLCLCKAYDFNETLKTQFWKHAIALAMTGLCSGFHVYSFVATPMPPSFGCSDFSKYQISLN